MRAARLLPALGLACALLAGPALAQQPAPPPAAGARPALPTPPPPPPPPAAPAVGRPPLVAELSQSRIEITTGFSGTELLVFGATERLLGPGGDDVLVVVQSSPEPMVVRRKTRVLGFWINGASARFRHVPGFYLLTGTRPLRAVLPPEEREAKRLGLDNLPLQAAGTQDPEFRDALMRLKQGARLWYEDEALMQVSGARLFRARIPLPATTDTGDYQVSVLLVRDGRVVARQELDFGVVRVGAAARIADVATGQPVLYGGICVLLAAFAGWLGSVLFRRG
ncbi:hypothetical protein E0493_06225 [Roseomonas sp. M0104]|uniref:TIGR02186 family protein n=1 Tax=Teichococcus coralli TaxID=2545983 RepID=A0A845BC67_9PROT|nr:TIGR02186 family protein [Pseudoroseomonas coralli]MXP62947.1 hypothetical protein [Pseudoroseomonas coralli]